MDGDHTPAHETHEAAVSAQRGVFWSAPFRVIEGLALFGGVPAAFALDALPVPMIPLLLLVALACFGVLWRDSSFDRRQFGNGHTVLAKLPKIGAQFAAVAVVLGAGVAVFEPQRLFELVRRSPALWATIMVLYPLLSVYPQEVIYRAYFFHRYEDLFPGRWALIAANAAAFGYMHIVFENAIAVVLTGLGGLLFAKTYADTRSLLAVSVEHALYGCFIFTIGLGWYFYGGAVR